MTACPPTTSAPASENVVKPRYTVNSRKDAYEVRVELPGVKKENIQINVDQGVLSLQAGRKPSSQESWKPLYRELNDFSYALRLKVNAAVNDSALTAKLEDGILTLSLPVKEALKPRVIAVQ